MGGMGGMGRWRESDGGRGLLTHPRRVKQILMRRSAPQPAMRKTPRGGTVGREGGLVRLF